MGVPKHRFAAFEVYPDSAIPGWWDVLKSTHGMYSRSLHHGGFDEGKDHFHVMYCHGSPTTDVHLKRCIPDGIAANGHIEIVTNPRGYMRYLIHLDDPDKEQFEDGRNHIECINGFPLDLSREYTSEERNAQRKELMQLIRDNGLCEYADLLEGLSDIGRDDLFDYAWNHTIALTSYLRSRRHRVKIEFEDRKEFEERVSDEARSRAELAAGNWAMGVAEQLVRKSE